jgi:hypothetical protein
MNHVVKTMKTNVKKKRKDIIKYIHDEEKNTK